MSKLPIIAIGIAALALGYFALVSDAAAYGEARQRLARTAMQWTAV